MRNNKPSRGPQQLVHVVSPSSGDNKMVILRGGSRGLHPRDRQRIVPQKKIPTEGPGTELKLILKELGFKNTNSCGCNSHAQQMNVWGVVGCMDHFNEIVEWLRSAQHKSGWFAKVKATVLALATGLAFKLDPLDPAPGIVTESIRRAEVKQMVVAVPEVSLDKPVEQAEGNV